MLQVSDARQIRLFQEGREEGREESMEKVVLKMLEKNQPVEEIPDITGLSPAQIRKLKKQQRK